jgi:hypothetical protein
MNKSLRQRRLLIESDRAGLVHPNVVDQMITDASFWFPAVAQIAPVRSARVNHDRLTSRRTGL